MLIGCYQIGVKMYKWNPWNITDTVANLKMGHEFHLHIIILILQLFIQEILAINKLAKQNFTSLRNHKIVMYFLSLACDLSLSTFFPNHIIISVCLQY